MKVSVLGTGTMGAALAEAILKAGHEVFVYNRSFGKTQPLCEKGAKACKSPSEALQAAEASILVLTDGAAVSSLLFEEATAAVLQGKKLLNASTTKYEEIVQIGSAVKALGGELAEVSIMVGAEQLRQGQGQFVLGGSAEDAAFWGQLLSGIGERVDVAGELGEASKAEIPILITSMFGVVTAAYAAASAIKLGLPNAIIEHYIPMSAPGSEYLLPNMTARNYETILASVDNFAAVAENACQAAESLRLPGAVLTEMQRLFTAAQQQGFGAKDGTAICEVLLAEQ